MSSLPDEFRAMAPFEPDEYDAAIESLIADPAFRQAMSAALPMPFEQLAAGMRACGNAVALQKTFTLPFLQNLATRQGEGLTGDFEDLTPATTARTYISNHRDIILDSGFLDVLLLQNGYPAVEIAIGDNLLIYPWIRTLVRLHGSFIVSRSGGVHELLASSRLLSAYMHYAIGTKGNAIWIAQREGRSKDSTDHTQDSLLKMMAIGGEGSVRERLMQLHLTPLAISYEYDPCDYLKAAEYQLKRDNPTYRKQPADDLRNMKTGLMGWKGHIHYHAAPCIDAWLASLPEMPTRQLVTTVAEHIDAEIYRGYQLYPANYAALALLNRADGLPAADADAAAVTAFEEYLASRLALIDIPNPDVPFLRHKMLEMYANPARHQLALQAEPVR